MKKLFLIICIFFPIFATSQIRDTEAVRAIADSFLKVKVGDSIFQYFGDGFHNSYFTIADKENEKVFYKHLLGKKLPKKFRTINFIYHFSYGKIEGLNYEIEIIFNKDFKLAKVIEIDFIPKFLIENTPPNFISKDSALAVVNENLNAEKCEILDPIISYSKEEKKFMYRIVIKLSKHINKKLPYNGELELILLNAYTGNLEHISRGYLGLFHK